MKSYVWFAGLWDVLDLIGWGDREGQTTFFKARGSELSMHCAIVTRQLSEGIHIWIRDRVDQLRKYDGLVTPFPEFARRRWLDASQRWVRRSIARWFLS